MTITGVVKEKINDWSCLVTWIMPIGDKPTVDEIKQTELLTIAFPESEPL